MREKRVLIWSKAISNLMDGNASGIAVQLYFWAQTFAKHDWQVATLTPHKTYTKEGIRFRHETQWGKMEIVHEWLSILWTFLTLRPQVVISRGAGRIAYPLAILSRWLGVKYVYFGASDVNFEPGKELIAGGEHNGKQWQKAVKSIKYIVVQNAYQQETLKKNYDKDSLILFNLWGDVDIGSTYHTNHKYLKNPSRYANRGRRPRGAKYVDIPLTDVVWVANLRRLKRAEWMVNAAKAMPQYDFTIVGGRTGQEPEYYEEIERKSRGITNLHFLGKKSLAETNAIVARSRLLCCTSTYEGFPNTFLQAWVGAIPVVSTVDPSEVITTHNLGVVVEGEDGFRAALQSMLSNAEEYNRKSMAVKDYFERHHSPEVNYRRLVDFLGIE